MRMGKRERKGLNGREGVTVRSGESKQRVYM